MKTKVLFLTLALGASTCLLTAQDGNQSPNGQRPSRREGGPRGQGRPGDPGKERGNRDGPPCGGGGYSIEQAISDPLKLTVPPAEVTRDVLLASMKDHVLASSELRVVYARGSASAGQGEGADSSASTQIGLPNQTNRGGTGGLGGQRPRNPVIEALDLNQDGTINAEEIAKASDALKKLDKNGDGKLTPDEYRPPRPSGPGGPGGSRGEERRVGPGGQDAQGGAARS